MSLEVPVNVPNVMRIYEKFMVREHPNKKET